MPKWWLNLPPGMLFSYVNGNCKTFPSAIFASRWTSEVLWSLSRRKIQKLFETGPSTQPGDGTSSHPLMSRKLVLLLSSSGAKWAPAFVVLHKQNATTVVDTKHGTALSLPCSNLKAKGPLNYSPEASRKRQQHSSGPWSTSCWCLTADWHEGNSPVGFNLFSMWPLN